MSKKASYEKSVTLITKEAATLAARAVSTSAPGPLESIIEDSYGNRYWVCIKILPHRDTLKTFQS